VVGKTFRQRGQDIGGGVQGVEEGVCVSGFGLFWSSFTFDFVSASGFVFCFCACFALALSAASSFSSCFSQRHRWHSSLPLSMDR